MTTLNTIIEEEKKKFDAKFAKGFYNGDWILFYCPTSDQKDERLATEDDVKYFLTTAMQRAYKQALEGVIQKATLKENPIEDNGELIDGSYYVIYKGYLDQLKK